ncbi:hypothetical protein MTO96_048820 [Rhipicephalus appendiculatus]
MPLSSEGPRRPAPPISDGVPGHGGTSRSAGHEPAGEHVADQTPTTTPTVRDEARVCSASHPRDTCRMREAAIGDDESARGRARAEGGERLHMGSGRQVSASLRGPDSGPPSGGRLPKWAAMLEDYGREGGRAPALLCRGSFFSSFFHPHQVQRGTSVAENGSPRRPMRLPLPDCSLLFSGIAMQ